MKHRYLLYLLIFLTIISCRLNRKDLETINVQRIEYIGDKTQILHYSLTRYDSANYKIFHYVDSISSDKKNPLNRDLIINKTKNNYVIFCSDTFTFENKKIFNVNHRNISVKKFKSGLKGPDTGLILYLYDDFGLIMIQSCGWGTKFTFIKDSISEKLATMLTNDSSGFILSKMTENLFFKE